MTDKLDFSGFGETPVSPEVSREKPIRKATERRSGTRPVARNRRKVRVNVSLTPELSRRVAEAARDSGSSLSDVLRVAYRDHHETLAAALHGETLEPFEASCRPSAGRFVHMLYLTPGELQILDSVATKHGVARSRVVSELLNRATSN